MNECPLRQWIEEKIDTIPLESWPDPSDELALSDFIREMLIKWLDDESIIV